MSGSDEKISFDKRDVSRNLRWGKVSLVTDDQRHMRAHVLQRRVLVRGVEEVGRINNFQWHQLRFGKKEGKRQGSSKWGGGLAPCSEEGSHILP